MSNVVTRGTGRKKALKTPIKASDLLSDERLVAEATSDTLAPAKSLTEPLKAHSGDFVPSEIQGHAIRIPESDGEAKVLVLEDQTERYYSHSTIEGYSACGASAYFRKTKAPQTEAYALVRGSACHEAIETKIKTGSTDAAMSAFDNLWELMVVANIDRMPKSDQWKARNGYEESAQMVREFCIENDVLIQKKGRTESEVEFSVNITMNVGGGKFTRRMYGKIDWVIWDAAHTKYMIMDFKSSAQVPKDDELDRKVQFALYQYACTQLYGKPPEKMFFYYLRGKHKCLARGAKCKACQNYGHDPEWKCDVKAHNDTKKFSKEEHPRPRDAKGIETCLQYQFEVGIHSDEDLQTMFDSYYAPAIISFEAGIFQKNLSDSSRCVNMCNHKDHCDTVRTMPLPTFVKVKDNP